jgi:hypothetical protein
MKGHAMRRSTIRRRWALAPVAVTMCLSAGVARAADPTTADCIAANEASIKLRREHKLRAARAQLMTCAAASCPGEIRRECTRRLEVVNTAIPTVVFETVDASNNDLAAVRVTVDGEVLVERLEGTALSVDPGPHTFTFEVPGKAAVRREFVILEAQKDRRLRVELSEVSGPAITTKVAQDSSAAPANTSPAPILPVPTAGASPVSAAPVGVQPSHPKDPVVSFSPAEQRPGVFERLGTQRTLALASAAVGIVGLGVGIGFGLKAMSRHDDAQTACPGTCADQHGVDLWNRAVSAGTVSTVGFIVTGVGLAGAGVLWFVPRHEANGGATTTVAVAPGMIGMRGIW